MQRTWLFALALLVMTLVCFWPVGGFGFIGYDDFDYVYENPVVKSGLNYNSLVWAFSGAHACNWHPVTWLSHILDCDLFGLDPHEEHWMNLGLHAANVLLLFLWLDNLTGARWRSFFVAAFFAVHPLHVQSVAWISERKDVLSGFFFMAVVMSYTRYCRNKNTGNHLLVVVMLALGLMAKPMLVTVPFVLLLLDYWPLKRAPAVAAQNPAVGNYLMAWRPLVAEKIPLFLLCAVSCVITLLAQAAGGATDVMQTVSFPDRLLNAVASYGEYLWKMVYPANLAILYPLSSAQSAGLAFCGSLLLVVIVFVGAIRLRGSRPFVLVGWTWFFVMLLPVIGLIQVGSQAMADRYTYLPSIGVFVAVVWGLADLAVTMQSARGLYWGRAAIGVVGGAALLACAFDTRHQLKFWRNNITLFQHVVDVSPKNDYLGYFYLGISYGELGELDLAARCLNTALEAKPDFLLARGRLGNVLLLQKKYAEAAPYLESVASSNPQNAAAHVTLGMALAGQQKYAAAQNEYEAAVRLKPNDPVIQQLLAANAPDAQAQQALMELAGQLANHPTPEIHAQIALNRSILGQYSEAVREYNLALAQKPDFPEWLNNEAWILATCPDNAVRNGSEAVRLAQHACELTQYKKTVYIGTLAAAHAEAGQFDAAVLTAKQACDNAAARGETGLLEANQKLLGLYENHQPYHAY